MKTFGADLVGNQRTLPRTKLLQQFKKHRGRAAFRDAEEPLDVAPGEEWPVELLKLLMASGMARSHRGFAGTVQSLTFLDRQLGEPAPGKRGSAPGRVHDEAPG